MTVGTMIALTGGALGILATLATALVGVWRAATQYATLTAQVAHISRQLADIEGKVDRLGRELHERISKVREHVDERIAVMERRLDDHSKQLAVLEERPRKAG